MGWEPDIFSLEGRTHPASDDCCGRDDSCAYVVNFSEIILLIHYGCECLIARSMSSFVFGASRKSTWRSISEDNWNTDPRTAIVPRRHLRLDAFTDRRPSRETSLAVVITQYACAGRIHVRQHQEAFASTGLHKTNIQSNMRRPTDVKREVRCW